MSAVDCEGCTAPCCRSFALWHEHPDGQRCETSEHQARNVFTTFAGAILMKTDFDTGGFQRYECLALVESRCSVYEQRPQACQEYDCRTDESRFQGDEHAPQCVWPR